MVDHADEFQKRVEKYMHSDAKAQFATNIADRKPARNVKVGRAATPGTSEYDYLQKLLKKDAVAKEKSSAPTSGRKK